MPFGVIDVSTAADAPTVTLGNPKTATGVTLDSLVTELDALVAGRGDFSSTRLKEIINDAYLDVCTALDIVDEGSFAMAVVAGQPLYTLPDVVQTITSVSMALPSSENVNEGYPLDKIDLRKYRAFVAEDGDPRFYFRLEQVLVLYPTPDEARTIAVDCVYRPAKLVAAADSPIFGLEWHEVLKKAARAKLFSAMMEFDKAQAAENEWTSLVRRRRDRGASEDDSRIIRSSVPHREPYHRNRTLMLEEYD